MAISVVINTFNVENDIERCLKSIDWADEIIVWDAESTDATRDIAQKFTNKVFTHQDKSGYVEPQRNAAIEKATHNWILVIDADEEVSESLAKELNRIAGEDIASYVEIPRKNIIFGQFFADAGWWPDYNIRFFKKGSVSWTSAIHIPPQTQGDGIKLPAKEEYAIIHHHYQSVSQFIERLNRYTTIQAKEIAESGYQFFWPDMIRKPLSEFLTRFFVWEGYKGGVHGLIVSLLQAFSFVVVYAKVWELHGFKNEKPANFLHSVKKEGEKAATELAHWHSHVTGKTSWKRKIRKIIK